VTAKDTFGTPDDGDGLVFCLYDAGGLVARDHPGRRRAVGPAEERFPLR
jgi:hypothetical protein